jgi:NAD(P)H-dependent FMN reductase
MKYSVVAIAGAIEELSLAKNILAAAQKIDIGTLEIEVCPIQDLPLLNVDLFTDAFPKAIERLRKRVG